MIDKILKEYEDNRTFAEISRKKRIEEVYNNFNKLESIWDEYQVYDKVDGVNNE